MDFIKLFQSLENAVYEIVTWVMFLPKTLLYTIAKPAWAMEYVNAEWKKEEKDRFDNFLSPVILWLLVVIVPMLVVPSLNPLQIFVEMLGSAAGDASQWETEQQAFFILLYGLVVPVSALIWLEWRNRRPLQKSSLKRNFYQQCYAIAPAQFLYVMTILVFWNVLSDWALILMNMALPWFYQIFFFRSELETIRKSWWKAALHAWMPQVIVGAVFFLLGVFSAIGSAPAGL